MGGMQLVSERDFDLNLVHSARMRCGLYWMGLGLILGHWVVFSCIRIALH